MLNFKKLFPKENKIMKILGKYKERWEGHNPFKAVVFSLDSAEGMLNACDAVLHGNIHCHIPQEDKKTCNQGWTGRQESREICETAGQTAAA